MHPIAINTRILAVQITGVQRYTAELLARWNGRAKRIAPEGTLRGLAGHAWEQLMLPTKLGTTLLFSPSNTGPLLVESQVVTMHDMSVFDHPEGFNRRFAEWYRFLLPRLAHRARAVITDSEFTKDRILKLAKVQAQKVVVIHLGVDERFRPVAIPVIENAMKALNLPSWEYVLAVGSLEPRKNLGRLFQAWGLVQKRVPHVWLVVAGSSRSAHVFKGHGLESIPPRVFLTGQVRDDLLPGLYAGATALVYPSLYEGFGLPPLEAMACGTPVLVGNRASLPEIVADAGLQVDPCDIEAIAEGIRQLVEDGRLRESLRQKGFVRAKRFSWDETARTTWGVLEAAAA